MIRLLWQHAKILCIHHFSECAKSPSKWGTELSMIVCQVIRDQSIWRLLEFHMCLEDLINYKDRDNQVLRQYFEWREPNFSMYFVFIAHYRLWTDSFIAPFAKVSQFILQRPNTVISSRFVFEFLQGYKIEDLRLQLSSLFKSIDYVSMMREGLKSANRSARVSMKAIFIYICVVNWADSRLTFVW